MVKAHAALTATPQPVNVDPVRLRPTPSGPRSSQVTASSLQKTLVRVCLVLAATFTIGLHHVVRGPETGFLLSRKVQEVIPLWTEAVVSSLPARHLLRARSSTLPPLSLSRRLAYIVRLPKGIRHDRQHRALAVRVRPDRATSAALPHGPGLGSRSPSSNAAIPSCVISIDEIQARRLAPLELSTDAPRRPAAPAATLSRRLLSRHPLERHLHDFFLATDRT